MLTTFSCVKAKGSEYFSFKIDFPSSVLEFRSNPFRSETNLPSCVFSIIIVGVKNWHILKKSFFSIFYRFQTLLQKAQNENQRRTTLLRMPKKFRKRGSITFRLSNLVEEHLSYLWIYFGRLADVCYFRKWIFAKKIAKKGKYTWCNHPKVTKSGWTDLQTAITF